MFKKIFILIIIIIAIVIAAIYIYRHAIIQYYAEKIIRENLPSYVKIDRINFDFAGSKISLNDFKILNPPGFSSEYLLKINDISCRYGIKGKGIPEGIEISDVFFKGADIEIERHRDGRINVVEMGNFIKSITPKEREGLPAQANTDKAPSEAKQGPQRGRKLSDIIELPGSFGIKDGRIAFLDALPYDKPHLITVNSLNGEVSISLDDNYSKILALSFTLEGNMNESRNEVIKWKASLNPATPRITMSNRFDVSSLDLLAFEPYYDKFSPFVFKRGMFSGALVFDFDNGNIGSTNEIILSHIQFYIKPGYESSQMWETNAQDLMRYFTTTSGDIVFDFKIKGDMTNPQFYLGPISKRAITSMAIDKISSVVEQITKQGDAAGGVADKAGDYIDLIRGFINKK